MDQSTLQTTQAIGHARTAKASRYLQQLCKHWEHSFKVEFTPERGMIRFPHDARGADWPGDAQVFLVAGVVDLEVRIEASCQDQLEAIKGAVQRHLDRFAFKEAPLAIAWK